MSKIYPLGIHGLVADKTGRCLVLRRSDTDKEDGGCWDLPGGGVEEGESAEDGFRREVREETGITIGRTRIIYSYIADDGSLQLIARAEADTNEVKLSGEHSEYKWVAEEELLALEPAGLHLKAVKFLMKTGLKTARYEEYK